MLPDDVRETMRNADIQLEAEINQVMQQNQMNVNGNSDKSEDEDNSSQCSEFVEASNMDISEDPADRNEVISKPNPTPIPKNIQELERTNKAFLDQSWANIAENEDAEQRLINALEKEDTVPTDNDGFQVVKTRNKQNMKNNVVKNSYATRGKSVHTKPFR